LLGGRQLTSKLLLVAAASPSSSRKFTYGKQQPFVTNKQHRQERHVHAGHLLVAACFRCAECRHGLQGITTC
jgi:hypothetical protein